MDPWWSTAVNTGGCVAIPQAGSTSGPQVGSMPLAGGGGTATVTLSRWRRWLVPSLPCCTMPRLALASSQTKTPGQWSGVFALVVVVVGLMVVKGMAPGTGP